MGSVATLNSFGYVINGDPTSSSYLRPIYVDNTSTLILNNTVLHAYEGYDLRLNVPYPLVEKQSAPLNSALLGNVGPNTGFSNNIITSSPYLTASWYNNITGADAEWYLDIL